MGITAPNHPPLVILSSRPKKIHIYPSEPAHYPTTSIIMPRGNASVTKCHYKGKDEDFIVFVESADDVEKWKNDSSIPLAQVVSGFKIMTKGTLQVSENSERSGDTNITKGGTIGHATGN